MDVQDNLGDPKAIMLPREIVPVSPRAWDSHPDKTQIPFTDSKGANPPHMYGIWNEYFGPKLRVG